MEQAQLIERFGNDSDWFYRNTDKLREEGYVDKFVAIKNFQPIASDENIDVLIGKLEERKENLAFVFIEFVYPKDYVLLL